MKELVIKSEQFRRKILIESIALAAVFGGVGVFFAWAGSRFTASPLVQAGHAVTAAGCFCFLFFLQRARLRQKEPCANLSRLELAQLELARVDAQIELFTRHILWPLGGIGVGGALILYGVRPDLLLYLQPLVLIVVGASYRAARHSTRLELQPLRRELQRISRT
jgi:hypothetical protein